MTQQTVMLPENYVPKADEKFMSPLQLEYFRQKLLGWRQSIREEIKEAKSRLKAEPQAEPDVTDRAELETIHEVEIRTMEREHKLLFKIEEALGRIEDGKYGYCRLTGKPIELKRLEARPIATLCLEAQERHERKEKNQTKQ